MKVSDTVSIYLLGIQDFTEATQRVHTQRLTSFAAWCEQQNLELEQLTNAHIRQFTQHLATTVAESTGKLRSTYTTRGYIMCVKTFMGWISKEPGMEDMVSEKLVKRIKYPAVVKKVIEIFTEEQIAALFAACNKEMNDRLVYRDKAILSILIDCGIRSSELCGLTLDNLHLEPYNAFLKCMGKGRKEREIPIGKACRRALSIYITRYRRADKTEKHVFLNCRRHPLTPTGLDILLYRLARWAEIIGVRPSAHTFRHYFACSMLTSGNCDVYMLSRLLGHNDVSTSTVYLNAVKAQDVRKSKGIESVLDGLKFK